MEKKFIIRLVFVVFLLYSFYLLGTPAIYIPFMGIFFVSMIILRGKIYKKTENYLDKKLPFMQEWSHRKKRILIILIFIIVSVIAKQILFFGLLVSYLYILNNPVKNLYLYVKKHSCHF